MFEKIVLRRSEDGLSPTVGDLAEALLFYRHVHLMLDRGSLRSLAGSITMDRLIGLLRSRTVSAVYCRDMLCTYTQKDGALEHHYFTGMEVVGKDGSAGRPRPYSVREEIEDCVKDTMKSASRRAARKLTDRFLELVPIKALAGGHFIGTKKNGLLDGATADVFDSVYLTEAFASVLRNMPGFAGFPAPLAVEAQRTYAGFTIFSNLDLGPTNIARSKLMPSLEPIRMANLLNELLVAHSDLLIAAHYGSDFSTSRIGSSLMALRHQELLRRSAIHAKEIQQFQEIVVREGRSLKEVMDSGERTFKEFMDLLERSTRFRQWTDGIHPDGSMVAEYLKEASAEGWLSSLPGKGLRFVIGGAMDLMFSGSGTLFGFADSMLGDKMAKGWRPNHFVSKRLLPFVAYSTDR